MVGYEDPTFFVKSGDGGFADRQKNIFDKLTVVEKETNERQQALGLQSAGMCTSVGNSRPMPSRKRCRSEMKQFRGKESIFKKPDAPPPRFKNRDVPDYHRNPHKWVKYSLGDVSPDDMSEKSNTAAALTFLREIEERKNQQKMEVDSEPIHITFKPKDKTKIFSQHDSSVNIVSPLTSDVRTTDVDEKPHFRSSKLIMPEYVVGMTKKKKEKKREKADTLPETVTSQIKLQHLMDEDDGEGE